MKKEKHTIIYTTHFTYGVIIPGWKREPTIETFCIKEGLGELRDYLHVESGDGLISKPFRSLAEHKALINELSS